MKKLYLFLPLLCLMPAACSTSVVNEPETETHAINFRTPQAETRAVVDDTSLPGDFLVWGGYDGDATRVFDGTTVYHPTWDYRDGTRYWTENKLYDFYAVYPATGVAADVNTDGTLTISNFDCSKTGKEAVDLMTATIPNVSADEMIEYGSAVGLTFQHELARVSFTVKSEYTTVTVNDFRIYGIYCGGSLSKAAGDASEWTPDSACTPQDTPYHITSPLTLNTTNGLTQSPFGDLLLPPHTSLQNARLYIAYQYPGESADHTSTLELTSSNVGEWKAGHPYQYTVTIEGGEITLQVTVKDWEEEDTSVSWDNIK